MSSLLMASWVSNLGSHVLWEDLKASIVNQRIQPFLSHWMIQASALSSEESCLRCLIGGVNLHYIIKVVAFTFWLDKSHLYYLIKAVAASHLQIKMSHCRYLIGGVTTKEKFDWRTHGWKNEVKSTSSRLSEEMIIYHKYQPHFVI